MASVAGSLVEGTQTCIICVGLCNTNVVLCCISCDNDRRYNRPAKRVTIKISSSSATAPETETVKEHELEAQELRVRRERLSDHVFNFGAGRTLGAF